MDRTQKKCLMASVAMHALLVVILAVAPAFLKKDIELNAPPIDFIPSTVLDDVMNPGGGPAAPKAIAKKAAPPDPPDPPVKTPRPAPSPPKVAPVV